MDSLSREAVTSSGKGSRLARRSSSPFSRSRCRLDGLDLAPSAGGCLALKHHILMVKHLFIFDFEFDGRLQSIISREGFFFLCQMLLTAVFFFLFLRGNLRTLTEIGVSVRTLERNKEKYNIYIFFFK